MNRIQSSGVLAALAVGALFAGTAAQAEMLTFAAELTGAAGVPPTDSTATGSIEVTLDTEAKTVSWLYDHDDLSGEMTASHIHGPAAATEAAAPVIDTSADSMADTVDMMEGTSPITDEQIAELMAGMYYFNIHTEKFPDGEIRGQLVAKVE